MGELRRRTGAGMMFESVLRRLSSMGLIEEVRHCDVFPGSEVRRRLGIKLTEKGRRVAEHLWIVEELIKQEG